MMEKLLVKKPEPTLGKTNKPVQKKPEVKKKNVRITDHNILMTILLNDPDALTTEEFLFLQSVVGFHQATIARQEGKKRKQQRKLQGMNSPLLEKPKLESKPAAPGSGLPDNLRAGLEKLSGVELSDVKVHQNSHKPQQVGALAYTKGKDIHIAPGQERYLPHEGWHAVQQKQGIVSAEFQLKSGLAVNADEHLEKEADIMGKKAENNSEDSILRIEQTNGVKAPGTKGTVIQRVTTQEEGRALHNTRKQETEEKAEIIPAAYGETSENVKKIQQVLMSMNYWTGRSGDKASEYFGDVTRESLINFQTGYMKLDKQELYDKKGKYVGCGPSTAKSLNTAYKLLNNSYVPEQAKNGIMGMGKSPENNSAYNWDIKAGVYNAYVKEAQVMLMNMGYRLPEYGADGKWSNSGETYEALLGFQKSCKSAFEGVKKNGNAGNLKPVEHFQGIEPTGSLNQRTYAALQKEKTKRVNVNYNNTTPKKVENGKNGTGNTADLIGPLIPQEISNDITALNIISLVTLYKKMSATERIEALLDISKGSNNTLIRAGVIPAIIVNEPQKLVENIKAAVQFQLNIGTNFEDPDMAEAFASVFTAYITGKLAEGIKLPSKGMVDSGNYIVNNAEKIADDIININKKYSNGNQMNNSISNIVNSASYYENSYDQVASITRSITQHAFENGNKRTAFDTLNKLLKDMNLKNLLNDTQKWDLINKMGEGEIKNVTDISRILQGK